MQKRRISHDFHIQMVENSLLTANDVSSHQILTLRTCVAKGRIGTHSTHEICTAIMLKKSRLHRMELAGILRIRGLRQSLDGRDFGA
jgi:hypothetical protein